jgi:hypothetical protein
MHDFVGRLDHGDCAARTERQSGVPRTVTWRHNQIIEGQSLHEEAPAEAVPARVRIVKIVVQYQTALLLEFFDKCPTDRFAIVDPNNIIMLVADGAKNRCVDPVFESEIAGLKSPRHEPRQMRERRERINKPDAMPKPLQRFKAMT